MKGEGLGLEVRTGLGTEMYLGLWMGSVYG